MTSAAFLSPWLYLRGVLETCGLRAATNAPVRVAKGFGMCCIQACRTQAVCVKAVPSLYAVVRRQQSSYPSEAGWGGSVFDLVQMKG